MLIHRASEVYAEFNAARQALAEMQDAEDSLRRRMEEPENAVNYESLRSEYFQLHSRNRGLIGPANRRLAHAHVLLSMIEYKMTDPSYSPDCKPAFAMSYAEIQDRLAEWIVDCLAYGGSNSTSIEDARRLLLAWCAQLLVVPNTPSPLRLFPEDFLDAARSIYAFAIRPEVADFRPIIGRNAHDAQLMLAYSAFPFLEGVVRRELSAYMDLSGRVLAPFTVPGATYTPRPARKGEKPQCNNLSHGLQHLEAIHHSDDLGLRLKALRAAISAKNLSPDTQLLAHGKTDLYDVIYSHRNSNLHGGYHVSHVGLASLLLATSISLSRTESLWAKYNELAWAPIDSHVPVSVDDRWTHVSFYPPEFPNTSQAKSVHCFIRWQRSSGGRMV